MNRKLIAYSLGLILIGGAIGYFAGPKVDGTEKLVNEALKSKDSALVVANENKAITEMVLKNSNQKISQVRTRLKKRNEDFKNDTIMPTDGELIQRARAITNKD